ncbi:YaiI/YqxD family protein [Breoghania sp.]|uniref:YaiI/YqxD family protein n=1 Tax=Breoghania sp. TaxID=2065378 RepID=UPI0029C9BD6B|nr:YaiI/YqxD family protein [Breoghania sp.]
MTSPAQPLPKPQIYVDADACTVKDEVVRVGERHDLIMHFVANQWMRLDDSPLVKRVIVPEGPDAADDWIADAITDRDICVTNDIPLASRCLEKGAKALGQAGKPFDTASIGMALAMRDLNRHLRETGEIRGGGRPVSRKDRSTFLSALENMVQALLRQSL